MSDEPRIAKYGMPASEGHHIVERHFVVMQERKLVEELHFQHALSVGPVLSAKLAAAAGRGAAPLTLPPVAAPMPVPAASAPAPRVARPGAPDGLRERLGLR